MRNRRQWRAFAVDIGIVGSIRALEVTYGQNGAHCHIHELLFIDPLVATGKQLSVSTCQETILSFWTNACESVGLERPNEHGIDVRGGRYASQYISKWGLSYELTKAHTKKGRNGSRTPWDLLKAAGAGDETAGEQFREFAKAFKGRKQLVWSKGLRTRLGLGVEKADKQLAEEIESTAIKHGELDKRTWWLIVKYGLQPELLIAGERSGWKGFQRVLQRARDYHTLRFRPRSSPTVP